MKFLFFFLTLCLFIQSTLCTYSPSEVCDSAQFFSSDSKAKSDTTHEPLDWIYSKQTSLVENALIKNPSDQITIVCLGPDCLRFISYMHAAIAKNAPLKRLNFVAVNTSFDNEHDLNLNHLNIKIIKDDIYSPGFINRLFSLQPDCIFANNIISKLNSTIEDNLHRWILAASNCLSVTVSQNENLSSKQVKAIAATMTTRISHTAKAIDLNESSQYGMWIFEKDPSLMTSGGFLGETYTLIPKKIDVVSNDSYYNFFLKPFNPEYYRIKQKAMKIARLNDESTFAEAGQTPRQVRQLLIKMPGTDVIVPKEFSQFKEAIQKIIDHNISINPEYENYYAYLNVFRGITKLKSYRGLSRSNHGDQMQSLNEDYWYNPDYSYIVSSTLPTTFYHQSFDFTNSIMKYKQGKPVNLYESMNEQALQKNIYHSENFCIYLLTPYIVHAASDALKDEFRVFMKVAFSSKRFYDNREERRNPAFNTDSWYKLETIGYTDGWLQHAHHNERFIKSDIISN